MRTLLDMWWDEFRYELGDLHWLPLVFTIIIPVGIAFLSDIDRALKTFYCLLAFWLLVILLCALLAAYRTYKMRHLKNEYVIYKIKEKLQNFRFKIWLAEWNSLSEEEKRRRLEQP